MSEKIFFKYFVHSFYISLIALESLLQKIGFRYLVLFYVKNYPPVALNPLYRLRSVLGFTTITGIFSGLAIIYCS